METRKKTRKAFPYSRKILQIFQNAQCREFTVNITPLDSATLEKVKPLSESEIARILESDTESSLTHKTLSPRTENRLREKENGMVLLPRSSYNEHPARKVLFEDSRSTRSRSSTSKNKNSSRDRTSHKSRSPAKHARNNSSHTTRSDPTSLGRGMRHKEVSFKLKSGKPSFERSPKSKPGRPIKKTNGVKISSNNNDKEYQIVLCDPIKKSKKQETDIEKLSLSELLGTEQLPSKLWEVERVPPLMVNTKSDATYNTIAAELDALMAEDKPEAMEVDTNQDVLKPSESETPSAEEPVILIEKDDQNETEDVQNESSKDIEMTVVSDEKSDTLDTEDTSENKVISETSEEATEDKNINTSPKRDNKEAVQPDTVCTLPNEETKDSEEIKETKNEDPNLDSAENPSIDYFETKFQSISSEIKAMKIPEEFPSIMDLLNEQPSTDLEEIKEEQTDGSQQKPDTDNPKPISTDACESSNNLPEESTNVEAESKDTSNGIITSVIFRRFSSDEQTYDRLVIFHSDLEYTVKINNKEVELLGAPRYMTSTEDLQILLQIVDEVSLDSFNVICKS